MAVGELDVDVVLARLSSRKIAEWQAFWELEPFGESWCQSAVVAAAALSPWRKAGQTISPRDFMPNRASSLDDEQSEEEMLAIFRAMAAG